jgi:membrane protein DedA with SNARE-associated domain
MVHRRRFLIFSLANWALAIALWSTSAYLGITSPTSLFVYSVLFVIALVAVIIGVLSWLVWRFGREPDDAGEPIPTS